MEHWVDKDQFDSEFGFGFGFDFLLLLRVEPRVVLHCDGHRLYH